MKKTVFHRLGALLLCLVLLTALVPAASADVTIVDLDGARQEILEAFDQLATVSGLKIHVDLQSYGLRKDQLKTLMEDFRVGIGGLRPWYFDKYEYTYDADTLTVQTLTVYRLDPAVYDYDLYDQKAAEILALTVFEGMTDWQKALSIHDYLTTHIIYDQSLTYQQGYDAIVRGLCVCSGYAWAYQYLLHQVGIESLYVSSDEMNHAWNLVKLDGVWYHADATWDDPTGDIYGQAQHTYFLISDSVISDEEHEHYGWDVGIACTDTSLDSDRFWHNTDSPIRYESSDVCYFREQTDRTAYTVYRRDREGNQTVVATTDAGFIDIGAGDGKQYFYNTCGLDLVDGRLYYADMTAVYSVKTDGTDLQTVYSHDYAANKTCIQGMYVENGQLHLTLRDHQDNRSTMTLTLPGHQPHQHSYTGQTVPATCSSQGYTQYTCDCGVTYRAQRTAKLEHTFDGGTVIKEATLTEKGIKRCVCTVCGQHKDLEVPILTADGNNPLTDADGVNEEEYTIRRIILIVGAVLLLLLLTRKKKKKK